MRLTFVSIYLIILFISLNKHELKYPYMASCIQLGILDFILIMIIFCENDDCIVYKSHKTVIVLKIVIIMQL